MKGWQNEAAIRNASDSAFDTLKATAIAGGYGTKTARSNPRSRPPLACLKIFAYPALPSRPLHRYQFVHAHVTFHAGRALFVPLAGISSVTLGQAPTDLPVAAAPLVARQMAPTTTADVSQRNAAADARGELEDFLGARAELLSEMHTVTKGFRNDTQTQMQSLETWR